MRTDPESALGMIPFGKAMQLACGSKGRARIRDCTKVAKVCVPNLLLLLLMSNIP